MKVELNIQFVNNPNGVYFGGQTMEIVCLAKVNENIKIRGIRLEFCGLAYVRWSTGSGDNRRTYTAVERYFKNEIYLTEYKKSGDLTLQPNQYRYATTFTLPANLPASYEGGYGHVRYSVKAVVDIPWAFDIQLENLFTVLSIYDLNKIPECVKPAEMTNSKMICCCCCATGPISAVVKTDRCGYVPGEAITFQAEIRNDSDRNILKSEFKLILVTTFIAGGARKASPLIVAKVEKPGFGPHSSDIWSGAKLIVPPVPPSELACCSIIYLQYVLELTVDVENTPFDLHVPIPVVIGNVPLQNFQPPTQYWGGTSASGTNNFSSGFNQPITQQPTNSPSAPPPLFAESMFGGNFTNQRNENGEQQSTFAPQYSYFNYGNAFDTNK